MKKLRFALFTVLMSLIVTEAPAHAFAISVFGGSYLGTNESGLFAAEADFGPQTFQFGPVFEWAKQSPSTHDLGDETRNFIGAVARLRLPILSFFADARAGYHWIDFSQDPNGTLNGFTLRGGLGYAFDLTSFFSVLPRFGFAIASTNSTYPSVDLSLGISIGF